MYLTIYIVTFLDIYGIKNVNGHIFAYIAKMFIVN